LAPARLQKRHALVMRLMLTGARLLAIGSTIIVAIFIATSLTSDAAPSCAPSRTAPRRITSRRPEWLSATFDAAGFASTERVGVWPWSQQRSTAFFEAVRNTLANLIAISLASLGVKGTLTLSSTHIKCLVGVQLVVAAGFAIFLACIAQFGDESLLGELLLLFATLGAAAMVEGILAMVPMLIGGLSLLSWGLSRLHTNRASLTLPSQQQESSKMIPLPCPLEETDSGESSSDERDACVCCCPPRSPAYS